MASLSAQTVANWFKSRQIFWIILIVGLIADLASKEWAESAVQPSGWEYGQLTAPIPVIEGVLAWKWAVNVGAAFSIFAGQVFMLATIGLIALGAIGVFVYRTPPHHKAFIGSLGLVASGAVGNIYDRIRFGWVRDFIYFDFDLPFHDSVGFIPQRYPVFNVADISILIGVIILFITSQKIEQEKKQQTQPG